MNGRVRTSWAFWAALGSLGLGCAREDLGIDPLGSEPEQLNIPFGLARVPPLEVQPAAGPSDLLLVVSSNLDQRFNAGTVQAYRLQALAELLPPLVGPCATFPVTFNRDYLNEDTQAYVTSVRTLSAGSELVVLQDDEGFLAAFPTRFAQAVTLVRVQTEADPVLQCRQASEPRLGATDCGPRSVIPLGFDDPMGLARVPGLGLVVYHAKDADVRQQVFTGSPNVGYLSVIDEPTLAARLDPTAELPELDPPALALVFGLDGIQGLALGGEPAGSELFLSTDREEGVAVRVARVPVERLRDLPPPPEGIIDGDLSDQDERLVDPDESLDLAPTTQGFGTRGLVRVGPEDGLPARLYGSVRIAEVDDSDNSALVVLRPTNGALALEGVLELGQELGKPFVFPFAPPGRRWLYVPDTRGDAIFVVDVTTDQPAVRARIFGRTLRTLPSGRQVVARTLATPLQLVFDQREGRRLVYVTNFENSTLAVIDATSENPLQHCLVARFGRDLRLDGTSELDEPEDP